MASASELAELIGDEIMAALVEPDQVSRATMLRDAAAAAFELAYTDADGDPDGLESASAAFVSSLNGATVLTEPDGTEEQVERVTQVWATAAANAAVAATAPSDSEVTWITMEDDRVRDLHVPLHGETRPAGGTFLVGGVPLSYPGQPSGPPEVWINCRCRLRVEAVTAAAAVDPEAPEDEEALLARSYSAEQRRQMAHRGTAMKDGSFPIADVEDLRNAIQAIGRAKDPEAAKRHIKRRARALKAENLIPDSWTASGEVLVAVNTRDAPGWLTHPRETQRLRNYWTKGEGAAKIRWGTPGDLTRCARNLRKYVGPQWVWGTCQNLHHAALGYFNPESRGRRGGGEPDEIIDMIDAAFTAAAFTPEDIMLPSRSLFENPDLPGPTPMTVRAAGEFTEYLGHLAAFGTCHVGFQGECRSVPKSRADYAYFMTGEVETDAGPVRVGQITAATGHAPLDAGAADAVRHYDDTGTVVADVAVGEDDYGIWAHGIARPGITDDQLFALRAGAPSGDWRRIGGNLEMVGALIVNVPGFPIPRAAVACAGERDLTLVAAGFVVQVDPSADHVADVVVDRLRREFAREERATALVAFGKELKAERVEKLLAAVDA